MAKPYKLSRDPFWTRTIYDLIEDGAVKLIVRTGEATSVTVSGPCPNCDHPFIDTDVLSAPIDVGGALGGSDGFDLHRVNADTLVLPPATLRCTCKGTHRGRPNGVSGCGIYFTVTATPDEP